MMARGIAVALLALCLVSATVEALPGTPLASEALPFSHRRGLRLINNWITNRGWGVEGNLGIGFKYDDYGGKVNFGPFKFKKNEAVDFDAPTLFQRFFGGIFG